MRQSQDTKGLVKKMGSKRLKKHEFQKPYLFDPHFFDLTRLANHQDFRDVTVSQSSQASEPPSLELRPQPILGTCVLYGG